MTKNFVFDERKENLRSYARVKGIFVGLFNVDWEGGECVTLECLVNAIDRLAVLAINLIEILLTICITVLEKTLRKGVQLLTSVNKSQMEGAAEGFTRAHIINHVLRFVDDAGGSGARQETMMMMLKEALCDLPMPDDSEEDLGRKSS